VQGVISRFFGEKLMDEKKYNLYTEYGFKALLCKGYHLSYLTSDDELVKRNNAKQPVTKGFNKDSYRSKSYIECVNWIKQDGWIGWLIPKGYIVLDIDKDVDSIKLIDSFIKTKNLHAAIHKTKNGKHYFFRIEKQFSAGTSVLTNIGIDKVTYRLGGVNYLILEPTEESRQWEKLEKFDSLDELPQRLLPIDTHSKKALISAISDQLRYYYNAGVFNGFEIDMCFIGYLCTDLQFTKDEVCEVIHDIFGDSYSESRTIGMYLRAKNKQDIQKAGTFVDILNTLKLENVLKLVNYLSKTDTHKNTINDLVADFNKDYFIIDFSGKVNYGSYKYDTGLKRYEFKAYSRESFNLLHAAKSPVVVKDKLTGKTSYKSPIQVWSTHQSRKYYSGAIYEPGKPRDYNGLFNMWTSFKYKPMRGDCELYLDHIKHIISDGCSEKNEYILSWLADAVQNLTVRPGVALCLRSIQGTGKGAFIHHFGQLFGQHYVQFTGLESLTTNFNKELSNISIVYADEVIFGGDHKIANKMKGLITEPTVRIELKNVESFYIPNYIRFIISGNNEWMANIESNDRRYFIVEVSDKRIKDYKYFREMQDQMTNGGYNALLYFLMDYKIKRDLRDFPETDAIKNQKLLSMSCTDEFFTNMLDCGDLSLFLDSFDYHKEVDLLDDKVEWPREIKASDFYSFYSAWCKFHNKRYKDKDFVFGRKLKHIFSVEVYRPSYKYKTGYKQQKTYKIPDLKECKEQFIKHLGYNPF
jgi:hypothetical protein